MRGALLPAPPDGTTPHGTTPLGILAGGSGVPVELAEAVTRRGRSVHIVGIKGEAEPEITGYPHTWVNWGGIGAMIRGFRNAGCRDIVIVGRVRRPNLACIRPDLGFFASLPSLLPILRGGDDAILRLVVGFFERHGLTVVGAHDAAPELLAPAGLLVEPAPTAQDLQAMVWAAEALTALGPFDAAQAAICGPEGLLAVEGADGTDAMLTRLANRRGRTLGGRRGVLVKLPKPQQELRIDLPAIGPETVKRAEAAGLAGIAVLAGATLIAERQATVRAAKTSGLYLIGVTAADLPAAATPPAGADAATAGRALLGSLRAIGRIEPRAGDADDAAVAAAVIVAVERFWSRASVIVSRGYVLATEPQGGAVAAAERAGRLKPWGARLLKRKVGVLAMSDLAGELGADPIELIRKARASGLAGIVVLYAPMDDAALAMLAAEADRAGLFLIAPGGRL